MKIGIPFSLLFLVVLVTLAGSILGYVSYRRATGTDALCQVLDQSSATYEQLGEVTYFDMIRKEIEAGRIERTRSGSIHVKNFGPDGWGKNAN